MESENPILLFDGVCNLCSRSVQFVLERNSEENIQFASLQSDVGKQLLSEHQLSEKYIDSLVLIETSRAYVKSDAALRLTKHLSGLWKLLMVFLVIPKFIRNPIYDWIARNRYRWFGKQESCWIPQPKWTKRFIDQ